MKSVLMFGFGNVAFKIDQDNREQKFSHIAVLDQLDIKVTAIIEKNPSTEALAYTNNNNIPLFKTYHEVVKTFGTNFDLGIFCLPTAAADTCLEILNVMTFARAILEKPISYDPGMAKKIFGRLRETDTRFSVNYQRNWDAGYSKIIKWIQENNITDAYCRSSTAIAQSGSHMIELILRLFPNAEILYSRPLESKRLIGGQVQEPGAAILFLDEDIYISTNFDSSTPSEFKFSGVIYSTSGYLSFDEGEGVIKSFAKRKGNKRMGSEIIFYNDPEVLYEWKDEPWLYGCYQDLLSNKGLKALQDRSLQVVEVINNVMN